MERGLLMFRRFQTRVGGVSVLLAGVVSVVLGSPAEARRGDTVTCGWCWDFVEAGDTLHHFPNGGDLCLWPPGEECSRCGGTSSCHDDLLPGRCHIECGGGSFAQLFTRIEGMIQNRDAAGLASLIHAPDEDYVVALLPADNVVEVVTSCSPGVAAASYNLDFEFARTVVRYVSQRTD
jgi:hypothetical protein